MKIIYTAQEIEGVVEYNHPPIATRVAREKLAATLDDAMKRGGLVFSYSITDDKEFPYPFDKPNPMTMKNGFFGGTHDMNAVVKEIEELYKRPKREFAEYEANLKTELDAATDEHMIKLVHKYHYMGDSNPFDAKQYYENAVRTVKEKWKSYKSLSKHLASLDFDGERNDIARAIGVLNDPHFQSIMRDVEEAKKLLKAGEKGKVREKIMSNYRDWRRKHLAKLYNYCGDAKFYGAGFWIARVLAPDEPAEKRTYGMEIPIKTAEDFLERFKMPFQVVKF